jgi:hypothetical protein
MSSALDQLKALKSATAEVSNARRLAFDAAEGQSQAQLEGQFDAIIAAIEAEPPPPPIPDPVPVSNAAKFIGTDAMHYGHFYDAYGADGYKLAGVPYDAALPSYAKVAVDANDWTWAEQTPDPRGLAGRMKTWYSKQPGNFFTLDISLTDGKEHEVSLYAVDFDRQGRKQRVDVLDADTQAVLDTQGMSDFGDGRFLSWSVTGHVVIRVAWVDGPNSVASGLFFSALDLSRTCHAAARPHYPRTASTATPTAPAHRPAADHTPSHSATTPSVRSRRQSAGPGRGVEGTMAGRVCGEAPARPRTVHPRQRHPERRLRRPRG